jgi:hypothetical protein
MQLSLEWFFVISYNGNLLEHFFTMLRGLSLIEVLYCSVQMQLSFNESVVMYLVCTTKPGPSMTPATGPHVGRWRRHAEDCIRLTQPTVLFRQILSEMGQLCQSEFSASIVDLNYESCRQKKELWVFIRLTIITACNVAYLLPH